MKRRRAYEKIHEVGRGFMGKKAKIMTEKRIGRYRKTKGTAFFNFVDHS